MPRCSPFVPGLNIILRLRIIKMLVFECCYMGVAMQLVFTIFKHYLPPMSSKLDIIKRFTVYCNIIELISLINKTLN